MPLAEPAAATESPLTRLLARGRTTVMGILNVTPDSFSDGGQFFDPAVAIGHARRMAAEGADILDIGAESTRPYGSMKPVPLEEEIARVVPVVERIAAGHDVLVSVDTYKPEVASAAIAAGAEMVNDVSGLRDERLAEVCARTGAALVVMHTRVAPKGTLLDPAAYEDVVADVVAFLGERMAVARAAGVAEEQIVLDPGPDFAKTPAQTVAVLRRLDALRALGRPLLLAVSRKDFVGAITGRPPQQRLAGTLAAVGAAVDAGAQVLRVHDVAAAVDFLRVRSVLRGEIELAPQEGLTHERYPA